MGFLCGRTGMTSTSDTHCDTSTQTFGQNDLQECELHFICSFKGSTSTSLTDNEVHFEIFLNFLQSLTVTLFIRKLILFVPTHVKTLLCKAYAQCESGHKTLNSNFIFLTIQMQHTELNQAPQQFIQGYLVLL